MRLSKSFKRKHFACECDGCQNNPAVDYQLVVILEDLAENFGSAPVVTSGIRCKDRNAQVGGASQSLHLTGKAADVYIPNVAPKAVFDYLVDRHPDSFGFGLYRSHVHVDSRSRPYRWGNT